MFALGSKIARWCLILVVAALSLLGLVLGCGSQPGHSEYEAGLRELRRGNYARARVEFEKSITKRPASEQNADAYNYLGVASVRLGQLDRAIGEFEESMRLNDARFEPAYNLAVVMYEGGDKERAKKLLQRAATTKLSETRALEYLGHIFLQERDWAAARRVFYQALERDPSSPAVLCGIALCELRLEGVDAAISYLMQALEKDPRYAPALFDLGLLYERERHEPGRAIAFYEQYLKQAEPGERQVAARRAYEKLLLVKQSADRQEDETGPAEADEEPAPVTATPPVRDFGELIRAASKAADRGDKEEALKSALKAAEQAKQRRNIQEVELALHKALAWCPDCPEAHYAWGTYCLSCARYEPALSAFKAAVALSPRWLAAHLGLAEAATETGEYDAALVSLKQAIRIDPRNPDVRWTLARLYDEQLHIVPKALKFYREFERMFPDDPRIVRSQERQRALAADQAEQGTTVIEPTPAPSEEPAADRPSEAEAVEPPAELELRRSRVRNTKAAVQAYNRGVSYQERKDWDRAIYYYRRAIENDNTFVNAYYNLGTVYRSTGEYGLAKDAYLHAVQLQPKAANARYNLALVYMDLGQNSAAIEQLRSVLRLMPNHAPSHHVLGLLYSMSPQAGDLAHKHFTRFLELAPSDPAAGAVRAWLRQNPVR